jgi:hypothetical protein
MAFSSFLKQVKFLNPEVQLSYKGIHSLHDIEGGKLLDYDNYPPITVDLNDPEFEAFDPMPISPSHQRQPKMVKSFPPRLLLLLLTLEFYFCNI